MRKAWLVLPWVLAVALGPPASCDLARFVLLHTNDTHTHFLPEGRDGTWGGVARMATLIDQVRAEGVDVLLLDAGDWSEGTVFHFAGGAGSLELELKSLLAYDAATVGNHDYLYDPDYLTSKIQQSAPSFPLLLANADLAQLPDLDALLTPHLIWSRGDLDVGIFGLSTDEAIYADFFAPGVVTDPGTAAEAQVADLLLQGADVIICLSHLGLGGDLDLAEDVPGIDLIVGGHSHDLLRQPITLEGPDGRDVTVAQSGSWYRYLGRLDLAVDLDTGEVILEDAATVPVVDVAEDELVRGWVDDQVALAEAKYGPVFEDTLAESRLDLPVLSAESGLANLATDAFLAAVHGEGLAADLAVTLGNFLASSIRVGPVHSAGVIQTVPYGYDPVSDEANTLVVGGLDGFTLKLAVFLASAVDQWVHVSGLTGVIDFAAGLGGIPDLYVNGEPLSDDTVYRVAMNSTEAVALGSFGIWPEDVVTTDLECWRVVADAIADLGTLERAAVPVDGRIRSLEADLFVLPEEIRLVRSSAVAGQGTTVLVRIRNLGERTAASGRVDFYFDPTPEDETDDGDLDGAEWIGASPIAAVPGHGQPGSGFAWITWDTTGLPASENHRIQVVIRDVVDGEGTAEAILGNNRTASLSTGLSLEEGPPASELRLFMPAPGFAPGDTCGLEAVITHVGAPLPSAELFVALDAGGAYFFGPEFRLYDPEDTTTLSSYSLGPLAEGVTSVSALPSFPWPESGDAHATGLVFWGALLDGGSGGLVGDLARVEFEF